MVAKKTKSQKQKGKALPSFVRIGGIVIIIILFIAFAQKKYLGMQSILPLLRPTQTPVPTAIEIVSPDKLSPNQAAYREKAIEDLAYKLNIDKREIRVISIEETNWPDTSLGCPEKGKFYTQVITPGLLITLGVKDNTYTYHAGLQRVITCDGGN